MDLVSSVLVGAITGAFTTWLSQWYFFNKKDAKEKIYQVNKDRLYKLYLPLSTIIRQLIYTGDGYDGLQEEDVERVIVLIEENIDLSDEKLESFLWQFAQELNSLRHNPDRDCVWLDQNHKFANYVEKRYKELREVLYIS